MMNYTWDKDFLEENVALMSSPSGLTCLRCGTSYPAEEIVTGCAKCQAEGMAVNLKVAYPASAYRAVQDARGFDPDERGVLRYHALLPIDLAHATWLGEGETPLIHAGALGELVGLENLYLKNETRSPTGSYKDRMAAVVIARARAVGAKTVTIASSGNAGAALAAYATVAGLQCVVFTSASASLAMKAQMRALGAKVVALAESPQRWTIMAGGHREVRLVRRLELPRDASGQQPVRRRGVQDGRLRGLGADGPRGA